MTIEIRVLGPGCVRCQALFQNATAAVESLGIDARVEKVEDIREILSRGILATPALVVNGELVMAGHVPSVPTLRELISSAT